MPLILGTNSIKDTGYNVDNSLRFEKTSSDNLSRTSFGTPTLATKFTVSFWFKRTEFGVANYLAGAYDGSSTNSVDWVFTSGDALSFYFGGNAGSGNLIQPNRLFRDASAWYHLVYSVDTTQGTDSNRVKIYINGVQETSFSSATYPPQDATCFLFNSSNNRIADNWNASAAHSFNGYIAEFVHIDGQQLTPTSFGEFDEDTGIWKPIDVSGLTFGTNGFYLDFENSGSLGADVSGNGNNFTVNNLTSVDQSTDTCTNNYCTMNPLDHSATHNSTFSEGNLKVVTSASLSPPHFATFGLTTGKWYWEVKATSFTENPAGYITIGITGNQGNSNTSQLGALSGDYAFVNNGNIEAGTGNDTSYGNSYTQGQIIGVYLDLDNNKLYFSINGTLQNSGTGHSILASSSTTAGFYMPSFSDYSSSSSNLVTVEFNFGAGTSFAISSGNTDGEYGNFEYSTTITGDGASKTFKALNTKNLAEFG
jgi:hypothetical protein